MKSVRNRLVLVFVAATLTPLLFTARLSVSLLERSLSMTPMRELDGVSKSLEAAGRELYQRTRDALKRDAAAGRAAPEVFAAAERARWPAAVREFWTSGEAERFALAGEGGERLDLMQRRGTDVRLYSAPLGVPLGRISGQYAAARAALEAARTRDWRRGFTITFLLVAAAIWMAAFAVMLYWAHRIVAPIRQLARGLSQVAAGRLECRVLAAGNDEIGTAVGAFNDMAGQLRQSRDRLVYVTRLESWQALARKMAHEIKNSLTPIRLTMEEIAVRGEREPGGEFLQQAAQIVVDEVMSLERRVRAFSQLGAEPPVSPKPIDVNALLEERVALLKTAHPAVRYSTRLAGARPTAFADEDLVKGMLTNLLENAAQAVKAGGAVLGVTSSHDGRVAIEVHDSGPGLNASARRTLFEPTISFKPGGMGLGLSIARKSALLSGGDIDLVDGELGGAAFRVLLPAAH